MFDTTKRRLAALAIGGLTASAFAAAMANPAMAAPEPSDAQYARVAGLINGDGSIEHERGIDTVVRAREGVYCVRTALPNVRNTVPVGNAWGWGRVVTMQTYPHAECGNRADTVRVTVSDHNRRAVDERFNILIP